MNSPLEYDESIVKEFGIKAEHELDAVVKLNYVRSQLDEIKKFLWRERVELQLAEAQVAGGVEALIADARNKVAAHRTNLKGIIASIDVLNKLVHELEAKVSK